jgi:cytochrome c2
MAPLPALRVLVVATLSLALSACDDKGGRANSAVPRDAHAAATLPSADVAPPEHGAHDALAGWTKIEERVAGDAAHGKALVARYECNRCHGGTEEMAPSFDRACARCHQAIVAESLPFPREKLTAWHAATRHYVTVPTLASLGKTLRPSWIAAFVHEPVKIRPHEEEWMPRLKISESDARDLATYLTRGADPPREDLPVGDVKRGAEVVAKKGCLVCHAFSGASPAPVGVEMPNVPAEKLARGMTQAPDLRLARERFRPDVIVRWIVDPSLVREGAEMPTLGLSPEEAKDAAAYILETPLAAPPAPPPPITRLPVLDRHVSYEEVADKVFKKACTHCHADRNASASADPGPGAGGGFGFKARGVELLSFAGTQRGYIGEDRARHSLFAKEPALSAWGGSRLVAALVMRHEETSGRPVTEVRGMPMGLPGLSLEDIQLVETWVSQGAKD